MLRLYLWGSAISGVIASALWFWSAFVKRPRYDVIGTFTADENGKVPAHEHISKVSLLNAWAAGFAGLAALLGALYNFATFP